MPTFFASNAIYPIALIPQWLKSISLLNALTYEVDGPRTKMLRTGQSSFGIDQDFAVPLITFAVLVTCATRMYPRMTEQAVHSSVRIKVNQSGLRVCSFDRG